MVCIQISTSQKILSVRALIFMLSQTLFSIMFTGLMSFGNPPINSQRINDVLSITIKREETVMK